MFEVFSHKMIFEQAIHSQPSLKLTHIFVTFSNPDHLAYKFSSELKCWTLISFILDSKWLLWENVSPYYSGASLFGIPLHVYEWAYAFQVNIEKPLYVPGSSSEHNLKKYVNLRQ